MTSARRKKQERKYYGVSDEIKTGVMPEEEIKKPAPEKGGVPGKYLARLIIVLTVVCAVVSALLATVNAVTKDKIAAHNAEAQENAVREVFPGIDDEIVTYEAEGLENDVYLVFRGGALAGYAARVMPSGFGGEIEMMVGVGVDGTTTGVSIISMSETPGVGSKTNSASFLEQFNGKDGEVKVGDGVDAISGATISSRAVTEGVRMAHNLGIDLEKIAKELGVSLWDGTVPESEETESERETDPVESESESETEPAAPSEAEETEEPFSENGEGAGGVLPVDAEETDDRFEVEIEREEYESIREETDETTAPAPAPAPTSAPDPVPTQAPAPTPTPETGSPQTETDTPVSSDDESDSSSGEASDEISSDSDLPDDGGDS